MPEYQHIAKTGVTPAPNWDVIKETIATPDRKYRPRSVRFTGRCPYCLGPATHVHALTVIPSVTSVPTGQGVSELDVTVTCTCTLEHKGRPSGAIGCGQSWTLTLRAES